jgi:ferredoxin
MPHQISQEKCTGCGTCAPLCPVDAISATADNKYQIDPNECVDCQRCEAVCPQHASTGGPKAFRELVTQ